MEGTDQIDHPQASEPMPALHPIHTHVQAPHPANADADMPPQNVPTETPALDAAIATQVSGEKEEEVIRCFFKGAQQHVAAPLVPFVWDTMSTNMPNVQPPSSGMEERYGYAGTNMGGLSGSMISLSASISKPQQDVQTPCTPPDTHVRVVESLDTEPSSALRHRRHPLTLYHPDVWLEQLKLFNLFEKYPNLYYSLVHGFDIGVPIILQTYVLPNNPSILKHPEVYSEIVENEFQKKRYIGPFSQAKLEALIGPFQSSPLFLVPKPGKPGKYHGVHDFSHPHSLGQSLISSINLAINSHKFPCTWGTFSTVCLIIYRLPPGSQASI